MLTLFAEPCEALPARRPIFARIFGPSSATERLGKALGALSERLLGLELHAMTLSNAIFEGHLSTPNLGRCGLSYRLGDSIPLPLAVQAERRKLGWKHREAALDPS